MQNTYALEWIDTLVSRTLDPQNINWSAITQAEFTALTTRLEQERENIKAAILNQVYQKVAKEKHIRLLLQQYHSSTVVLLDAVYEMRQNTKPKQYVRKLLQLLTNALTDVLTFIEERFSTYLSLNIKVPNTYLILNKREFKLRLDAMKTEFKANVGDNRLCDIVLGSLYAFTNKRVFHHMVTFREVVYRKELLRQLELLYEPGSTEDCCSALNELLVYLNYNSKAYVKYQISKVQQGMDKHDTLTEKLDFLLDCKKHFNQLQVKPGVVFNPQYMDLKALMNNWYDHEIAHLEKRLSLSLNPAYSGKFDWPAADLSKLSVLCNLSVDQISLFLRAADDTKVITATSLSAVYKAIVPFLSTPDKEHLSWNSMRSKSYESEDRDKELIIQALEKIISKIREY
ncbi:hypothetical protein [Mucilaginibacter defluvii]|uniref:Uncharacterized protein n=1 Tax=Mucilaginibacter defluvii TaxID=1196019 RepID=A0ABP9FKL0_9SPHI